MITIIMIVRKANGVAMEAIRTMVEIITITITIITTTAITKILTMIMMMAVTQLLTSYLTIREGNQDLAEEENSYLQQKVGQLTINPAVASILGAQ
jgi:hypothetical protein